MAETKATGKTRATETAARAATVAVLLVAMVNKVFTRPFTPFSNSF